MFEDTETKIRPRLNSCYKCGGPLYTYIVYMHGVPHAVVKCPNCDE